MMRRIACSLWDFSPAEASCQAVRLAAAGCRHFHWDFTDGVFAAPGGFSAAEAAAISAGCGQVAEAHLMVANPLDHVDAWTEFCDLVVVHAEAADCRQALRRIESRGCRAGVAISPATPLANLTALGRTLPVLVMSVVPGQAGGEFVRGTYARLAALRRLLPEAGLIGVDGSVTLARLPLLTAAGADWIISGSDLTTAADPERWLRQAEGSRAADD